MERKRWKPDPRTIMIVARVTDAERTLIEEATLAAKTTLSDEIRRHVLTWAAGVVASREVAR